MPKKILLVENEEIILFTEDEVLRIVDSCFHAYASNYRTDAREMTQEIIKEYGHV